MAVNTAAILVLLTFCVSSVSTFVYPPGTVILPEYVTQGFHYVINNTVGHDQTNNGFKATIFLGLPYAKPPVGDLRFEKPEPLPKFNETLRKTKPQIKASHWPKACHQVINGSIYNISVSEDCLYFNVFRPATLDKEVSPLPVLVFIHGGGYEYGGTEEYGYKYFVENFVTKNIIVVTLQYRLAHFGFMATPDGVLNGNYGHFDQLAALRFIKRSIGAFGGDSDRITLSGHSAGSVSVHSLGLSPHTVGLYHQEVHVAGSNYAQWPIDNNIVYDHTKNISEAMGCDTSNSHKLKKCLKEKKPRDFFEARKKLNYLDFPADRIDILYYTSVFDKDFFAGKNLSELQKAAPKRKILYGVDAGEGLLWSLYSKNPITNVFAKDRGFNASDRHLCTRDYIKNHCLNQILWAPRFSSNLRNQITEEILKWYKISDQYSTGPLFYFDKLTELYSDLIMKVPTGKEILAKVGYGFDHQQMFIFNYTRPQDRAEIGHLPGHGYFLMYFAGLEIYTKKGINQTAVDTQLQHDVAEMFTNFVKHGEASIGNNHAPLITKTEIPYLHISPKVKIDDEDIFKRVQFWDGLAKKYNWDFIQGIPL